MTYRSPQNSTQEFAFTALLGADILRAGDKELGRGECFTMPSDATASIVVTDDDTSLSGDANRDERGDDRSYQTADIRIDGQLVATDARIYAEEYYVVRDQHGRTYKLIEIELAGQNATDRADYYAFVGDVPPAGSTLKVIDIGGVCGSWVDYRELSAGLSWTFDDAGTLKLEAEDMELRGYQGEASARASGGGVIRLKQNEGSASVAFGGDTGTYTVELAYIDERDGEGEIQLWIGGELVRTVELTNNNNGDGTSGSSISTISFENLAIDRGDKVELRGFRDGAEYVRIDSLTFGAQADDPSPSPEPSPEPSPSPAPQQQPQPQPAQSELCIDFDVFADGSAASAGDKGTLVFDGVTFKAVRKQDTDGVLNDAMIYDSDAAVASGGDWDLLVRKGNLLIISEDGDRHDPDDNAKGGRIVATFDEPSTLNALLMVDIEETGGTIKLYDAAGVLLKSVAVPPTGDGAVQWVDLGGTENVSVMEVKLAGSGAIGAVKFVPGGANAGPVALDDAAETDEDTAVSLALLANDSDPDGDALAVTAVDGNAAGTSFAVISAGGRAGTATLGADGVLAFAPGSAFQDLGVGDTDTVTVTYQIADGNGGTDTAIATVTVHGLNDGPVAVDDAAETDEDTAVSLALLANDSDPDGDALAVTSINGHAAGASFAVTSAGGRTGVATLGANGTLTVDPSGRFDDLGVGEFDTVSVVYQITDGNGGTATARATVFVHGVNDAPVAIDDAYVVPETGLAVLDILANDSDPEGDPLTVTLLSQPVDGAVSVAPDGTVTFDPGTDFLGLSEGQTATVTFDYQISDGQLTDTATVTVKVLGQGVFEPCTVTEQEVVTVGGRPVTTTLDSDCKTNDGAADFRLSIALGDVVQSKYNVIYVIDVSGSTGVDGSFGTTTIIDAQIAALQDLTAEFMSLGLPEGSATITVLPFNSRALPTAPIEGQAYQREIFGDNEMLSGADVEASLAALQAGGETNYVSAVFATMGTIQQLEAQRGDAVNLVYFLSDGNPFPANSQPVSLLTQVSAQLKAQASVHGVAIGDLIDPQYVDALDNTGGAQLIHDDPTALGTALREAPFEPGVILGAALTLYDAAGAEIDSFHFTAADFVETPLGFELNLQGIAGFGSFAGQSTTAELVIDFDENGDLVADSSVSMDVTIEGVLPESFDL